MGRKALVDYSLIKEICENIQTRKKKFKGQLDLEAEHGPTKEGKKVKEIRRLLVSRAYEKKAKTPKPKKRKRSPERFCQNPTKRASPRSSSSSDSTSCSDEVLSDSVDSDDQSDEPTDLNNSEESDGGADDNEQT